MWDRTERQGRGQRIKQWHSSDPHHLFVIDLVTIADSGEEGTPNAEQADAVEDEDPELDHSRQRLWKNQDATCLALLKEAKMIELEEGKRARKRAAN
ncbi:unnamed protein product [Sphagnum jensenii]|uniref:Uncharacterized protein n=1 Tax=Sphagnum jensenii TaxID=128206 RepID=A0ABP1B706_9BRYO